MNNSVFGKTMENVKNRIDLRLAVDEKKIRKLQTKLQFKQSKEIDGLHLIELYRKEVVYDKPVYIGTSILDLSKVCMMDFHYNVIHKNFEGRYNLVYGDTDSFIYSIQHEDIYEWIKDNKQYFDLSESVRPDIRDNTNKKVIAKFKCESHDLIITDVLALTNKVYSYNCQTKDEYDKVKLKSLISDYLGYIPDEYSYESDRKFDAYETENTKKWKVFQK